MGGISWASLFGILENLIHLARQVFSLMTLSWVGSRVLAPSRYLQGRLKPDVQGISKLQEAVASCMLSPLPTDIQVQLVAPLLPVSLTLWGAPWDRTIWLGKGVGDLHRWQHHHCIQHSPLKGHSLSSCEWHLPSPEVLSWLSPPGGVGDSMPDSTVRRENETPKGIHF